MAGVNTRYLYALAECWIYFVFDTDTFLVTFSPFYNSTRWLHYSMKLWVVLAIYIYINIHNCIIFICIFFWRWVKWISNWRLSFSFNRSSSQDYFFVCKIFCAFLVAKELELYNKSFTDKSITYNLSANDIINKWYYSWKYKWYKSSNWNWQCCYSKLLITEDLIDA